MEDLRYWVRTDRRAAIRVLELVEAVCRDPTSGIGEAEATSLPPRRGVDTPITQEHRLVYLVRGGRIDFLQARYHYGR